MKLGNKLFIIICWYLFSDTSITLSNVANNDFVTWSKI